MVGDVGQDAVESHDRHMLVDTSELVTLVGMCRGAIVTVLATAWESVSRSNG